MKFFNYVLCFMLAIGLATSCTSSRQGTITGKSVSGDWTLQTINTEGIDNKFTAEIFNEANLNCFVGSSWSLSAANNTGSYNLVGGSKGCQTLRRNIHWTLNDQAGSPREFQFNRLDDNKKNIDDSTGFRLSVTILNKDSMQLKSAITFEGKPGNIVYNFVKK